MEIIMKQIKKFSDTRLDNCCIYCGELPDTRDHVPSKILLDKPYPENLPVVPSCLKCNQSFSKDEEYVACLIECTLRGTTDPEKIERIKIKEILLQKSNLRATLSQSMEVIDGQTFFKPNFERLKNVILKLSRGHATYENSDIHLEEPISISININPIILMTKEQKEEYFSNQPILLPEIGSRAFQRIFEKDETVINKWIIVQEDKYLYSFSQNKSGLSIKILLWNYLACEVIWD
jgi:hypothetical protein